MAASPPWPVGSSTASERAALVTTHGHTSGRPPPTASPSDTSPSDTRQGLPWTMTPTNALQNRAPTWHPPSPLLSRGHGPSRTPGWPRLAAMPILSPPSPPLSRQRRSISPARQSDEQTPLAPEMHVSTDIGAWVHRIAMASCTGCSTGDVLTTPSPGISLETRVRDLVKLCLPWLGSLDEMQQPGKWNPDGPVSKEPQRPRPNPGCRIGIGTRLLHHRWSATSTHSAA